MCPLQLQEQVSAQQAQGEEHAAIIQALEGAKSGREGELASRCTDLEAKLVKMDQASQLAYDDLETMSRGTSVWSLVSGPFPAVLLACGLAGHEMLASNINTRACLMHRIDGDRQTLHRVACWHA